MTCTACEGEPGEHGCPTCGGEGEILIKRCPGLEVDGATRRLARLCEFATSDGGGRLPLGGGTLDQTQAFLDALEFYEAERSRLKAKRDPLGLGEG